MMNLQKFLVMYGQARGMGNSECTSLDLARDIATPAAPQVRIKVETTYAVDVPPGTLTLRKDYQLRGPTRSDTATALPAGGGVVAKKPAAEARLSPLARDSANATAAGGAAPGAAPMV